MRVLVVHAHPDPDSYSRALRDATVDGLGAAGHQVDVLDLYAERFRAAMSEDERRAYETEEPILDPAVRRSAELVSAVDALVFVYPTWWWGLPAILKGWLDRVLVPGVAFTLPEVGPPRPALTNVRKIVAITTYGSSQWYMRLFTDSGRRTLGRTLRMVCHPRVRVRWHGMYSIDGSTDAERRGFLRRVRSAMGEL